MNEVIQNMADRRSVRKYTDRQLPEDVLKQIIEAGYMSPNAGNKQLLRMVVCENKEINDRLGRLRKLVTKKFWWPEENESFEFSDKELDSADIESSFYGAPCVVYLFSKKDFEFADGDAYIMANDLCLAAWGIPEDYSIRAHAILGYPEGGFPEAKVHDLYAEPLYIK